MTQASPLNRERHPMVVDAHNDLLAELSLRRHEPNPFERHLLASFRTGNVGVQVCAMGSADDMLPGSPLEQVLHQAAAFHKACRLNPEHVVHVRTAEDLDAAVESGRIGLILAFEGVDAIGRSADIAELFVDFGLRMVGVTHELRNAAADGTGEPVGAGLSGFGRQLVSRLVARGVIMDVAHASARTFDDVLAAAGDGHVLCSHASCSALREMPRSLTDDQLKMLSAAGGVVGIPAVPLLLHPDDHSIQRMVDHIVHAMDVAGERHVAIGSDFMTRYLRSGLVVMPAYMTDRYPGQDVTAPLDELEGPEDFARLAEALYGRGLTDAQIEAVLGGNLLGFLRRALA